MEGKKLWNAAMILVVGTAPIAVGQECGGWVDVGSTGPSASFGTLAFDAARLKSVLVTRADRETWGWSGANTNPV